MIVMSYQALSSHVLGNIPASITSKISIAFSSTAAALLSSREGRGGEDDDDDDVITLALLLAQDTYILAQIVAKAVRWN